MAPPLVQHLEQHGCRLLGEGGRHSVFVSAAGRTSSVPRHNEINDDLAKKICKDLGIPSHLFDLFDQKFGTARTERYHRLRALTYFEDAEQEPMPDMLVPFDWNEAKRFFTAEATRLLGAQAP